MNSATITRAGMAAALLSLGVLLSACGDGSENKETPPPPQAAIPRDAVGHYCGMFLFEHKGPKGQIWLRDVDTPVWFSTIREVFAYTLSPEEPKTVVAIYVQDMAKMHAEGQFPEQAWINARDAWYVIKSRYVGGMGAQDAFPFGAEAAAQAFQHQHGGDVVRFDTMPEDYIFGADISQSDPPEAGAPVAGVPS